jgi:membrane protein YdbS with pleckstrin-like domain
MDQTQRIEVLERLAKLRREGHISEAEYITEKEKLLDTPRTVQPAPRVELGMDEDEDDDDDIVLESDESEIDRFRGSTTGWLMGSLSGWGTVLLCLMVLVGLLAGLEGWRWWLTVAASLAGFAIIAWRFIQNISANYELTNQRLILRTGIFFKRVDEIELYRVKDARVDYSLINQISGIGQITMRTSDQSSQQVDFVMRDIPDAQDVRETIRMLVDKARQRRRVRELDVDEWRG